MTQHRFRWAVCQLDRLRRSFPASIRQALNELPRTLDETYERILLEIDEEKRVYTIRLFQCLAFSRRPLRVRELAEILAIQFDTAIPRLNPSFRPGDSYEAILSACSTLVTTGNLEPEELMELYIPYDDFDDCDAYIKSLLPVQFSHYSVKEFLTSERLAKSDKGDISQFYISPEPAHTILAQSCISALLEPDTIHTGIGDNQGYITNNEVINENYPLAKYAAANWFRHAWCDGVASRIQDGMERLFDPKRKHFAIWVWIGDIDSAWNEERSPLYYAALCGFESLVEHLVIRCRQDPNQSRGILGTPLHAAVVSGNIGIVQSLLNLGADVNALNGLKESPLNTAILFRNPDRDVTYDLLSEAAADAKIRSFYVLTPLHEDIRSRDLDVAQLLISRGADMNALNRNGQPPLSTAVQLKKHDFLELLLKGGADVNIRGFVDSTPLHNAVVLGGDLDIVQSLISYGADVNALMSEDICDGSSSLFTAIRIQRLDFMELLLKAGADVNTRNIDDETPLHEALRGGNLVITPLLISHGADVNALDSVGESPLSKAARFQIPDFEELLVKYGADVDLRNIRDSDPLHEASKGENLILAQLLIDHGADVNVLGREKYSPLFIAAQFQKPDFVELLLKGGADANIPNIHDSTPLHVAVGNGDLDIAQLLITHGANINALNCKGYSPLCIAAQFQNPDLVELLLKGGADANIPNIHDSTPLHVAIENGDLDVAQLLISHGADVNAAFGREKHSPLFIAAQYQKPDFVELLLKGGADVNIRNFYDSTPLHEAAGSGNLDIVKLLITHGADINVLDRGRSSPLHKAAGFQKPDVVVFPPKGGADVNVRNNHCSSTLHKAVESGRLDAFQTQLGVLSIALAKFVGKDVDSDVDARGQYRTPLHLASLKGTLDVSRLLIEHGADLNAQDNEGRTPFSVALASGHRKLALFLSNYRVSSEHYV